MRRAAFFLPLLFAACGEPPSPAATPAQSPAKAPAPSAGILPPGHPPVSGAADQADALVEKAPGKDAKTVAEIYAGKAALKGVEVVVRGRVVKFNPEIMGRNWIHLRDGSGSAQTGDNDITVTTTDTVAKGEVVTIRGKVALDQDFTAGYAYPVMIEGAKVVK